MAPPIRWRDDWKARPSKQPFGGLRPDEVRTLFIHHTTGDVGSNSVKWLQAIQRFHQDGRGWNDIAYSWLVDRAGVIWEGRGNVVGAHTKGYNSRSLAIAYLGDGDRPVPDEALRSIRYLAENLKRTYPIGEVLGHRDVGRTACPGDVLYEWVRLGMPVSRPERLPTPTHPDVREGWRRHLARMIRRR